MTVRCPPLALLRTLSPKLQRRRPKRLREGAAGVGGGFCGIFYNNDCPPGNLKLQNGSPDCMTARLQDFKTFFI
jgi:hypothetical protein